MLLAFQLGRTPNFYKEYCEELLLRESSASEEGESSSPDSRTPSPSDDDMVNDLVFHVTVEIKEEDRDRELIYEIWLEREFIPKTSVGVLKNKYLSLTGKPASGMYV